MALRLISPDGTQSYDLRENTALIVGRAPTCDLPVFDPTISRRHAELVSEGNSVRLRDLGSSNGTFVNGARVETAVIEIDDLVAFGKVAFRLEEFVAPATAPKVAPPPPAGATIVRQIPMRDSNAALASLHAPTTSPGGMTRASLTPISTSNIDKNQQKLATLLEVSKGLTRAVDVDTILDKIVGYAYQTLEVDRVAILLTDAEGELTPKISRDKRGGDAPRAVPQSIARKAVTEKVALLSDNAGEDQRFGGQSILMQQVRSAICAPLIGSEDRVLGVLYVDNPSVTHRFSDEDLEFLVAFAGIAAVAIENSQFAERIRREALVRSNFERYFAPQLAARIASSAGATRLGGDKRAVAVLFSDIRGFTALSETMNPDAMATLLTEYFTEMVECVFRHEGTLDKFIGDAVMAQWGAPIGGADDADRAMKASLEMMDELDKLNVRWAAEGRPTLEIGIGLNFGEAFAGNIGSERRFEFTVIGDTVNTASRLCSAAGGGEILLSDEMRRALSAPPPLAECPPMELKGKAQPVPVYRVVRE
ncbi:MAG: FHA domain-containing protein [Gemmatimonadaceae bacterium]|nr:FHA domain-containing protein [Geodermatophilaceae bacterium]MBA3672230.1 FHA domain-containing protein [Gemmatimonadaceae bacterium]